MLNLLLLRNKNYKPYILSFVLLFADTGRCGWLVVQASSCIAPQMAFSEWRRALGTAGLSPGPVGAAG